MDEKKYIVACEFSKEMHDLLRRISTIDRRSMKNFCEIEILNSIKKRCKIEGIKRASAADDNWATEIFDA
jgi:hypothetical protein